MSETTEFKNGTIATHNGQITIISPTGEHRTFMIRTQPADHRFAAGQRIVSLLVGRNNENPFDYNGFGFVNRDGTIRVWRKKRSGVFPKYARMLERPERYMELGAVYEFAGKCRVCNRTLTNPESIESGIGPVCAQNYTGHVSTGELRRAGIRGVGVSDSTPKRPDYVPNARVEEINAQLYG